MRLGDPHEIGKLMRARREGMGLTIEQMAQATGISPITIMRIELGRVGYVHSKTAQALEVPKRIEKRMVMVATPVDALGKPLERASGDIEALPSQPRNRPVRTKLEAKQTNVALHGKAHAMSPLKKMFLWLADKA